MAVCCVQCDSEFTHEELEGHISCPACGTKALPMDTEKNVQLKINTHELRILTMWADNWAREKCDLQAQKTLSCILQRLSKQVPKVSLTLAGEIRELQDTGLDASLIKADGTVLVPGKGKPS